MGKRGPKPRPFWDCVQKTDDCWVWVASCVGGYGQRHGQRAHRVSWELAHGPIPDGMFVCHRCDNPRCVKTEPDARFPDGHLFLGTAADNTRDMIAKGRARHATYKLNRDAANAIRARRAAGAKVADVAREFHVTPTTIRRVTNGHSYGVDRRRRASGGRRWPGNSLPATATS